MGGAQRSTWLVLEAPGAAADLGGVRTGGCVSGWVRVGSSWAMNLDGSDAAAGFSLPRLEVHPTAHGWRTLCLRRDGTRSDRLGHASGTVHEARAAAEAAWAESTGARSQDAPP